VLAAPVTAPQVREAPPLLEAKDLARDYGRRRIGAATPGRAAALGVRSAFVLISPNAAVLDQLAGLVDAGKLRPLIGGEFALRNVADAHALSESGRTVGKIVLYVGQP